MTGQHLAFVTGCLVVSCGGGAGQVASPRPYAVEAAGITLPHKQGWSPEDIDAGGALVFRLKRPMPVSGAPRIDVLVEPPREADRGAPTPHAALQRFLRRSLKTLRALVKQGQIRITYEDQRLMNIDRLEVYRLRHDYVLRTGGPDEPAISQVSYLLINNYQEVTVTAAGRTEFFQPLSDDIEEILQGMRSLYTGTPSPSARAKATASSFMRPTPRPRVDAMTRASYSPYVGH